VKDTKFDTVQTPSVGYKTTRPAGTAPIAPAVRYAGYAARFSPKPNSYPAHYVPPPPPYNPFGQRAVGPSPLQQAVDTIRGFMSPVISAMQPANLSQMETNLARNFVSRVPALEQNYQNAIQSYQPRGAQQPVGMGDVQRANSQINQGIAPTKPTNYSNLGANASPIRPTAGGNVGQLRLLDYRQNYADQMAGAAAAQNLTSPNQNTGSGSGAGGYGDGYGFGGYPDININFGGGKAVPEWYLNMVTWGGFNQEG
jgi:hypothetical protein